MTNRSTFETRRRVLRHGAAMALAGLMPANAAARPRSPAAPTLPAHIKGSPLSTNEELTALDDITTHTNFYEFSANKRRASRLAARRLRTRPWTVTVDGEIEKPRIWDIDDLVSRFPLEERIYRLRCVEAWSMVIPWIGFALSHLIEAAQPTSRAKFVVFEALHDPSQMPGQNPRLFGRSLDWPYVEGLRIDEAMHPLTILAVGLYGEVLPNQNGAPVRLVVPWKYGFKSIKSIVRIRFAEHQPITSWHQQAPGEYGFYANVNPAVPHPRWSQAREKRFGESTKRATLPFNSYQEQVAHLYRGMDLFTNF